MKNASIYRYPVAIETTHQNGPYQAVVPDLPGCECTGSSIDEALAQATQAISKHCQQLVNERIKLSEPSSLMHWHQTPQYTGWLWVLVDIDITKFENKAEKVTITMAGNLVSEIDEFAQNMGLTRSGFLSMAARTIMRKTSLD